MFPQIREVIIDLAEKLCHHALDHRFWHNFFIEVEFIFLFIVTGIFFIFACLEEIVFEKLHIKTPELSSEKRLHYVSLLVYILSLFIVHLFINPCEDDLTFNHALTDISFSDFKKKRYNNWSSRLIIESVLINCYKLKFYVWRVLDIAAWVLIAEGLVDICLQKQKKYAGFVYAVLLFFTDFSSLCSAGWGATTVNYFWPLAAAMPCFVAIKNIFREKPLSKWLVCISYVLLIFAANQEQVAALIFGLSLSFLIIHFVQNRKFQKTDLYLCGVIIISLLSIVFILTCPGNEKRFLIEINTWFPQYPALSLFDKVQLGVLTIFTYYFTLDCNFIIVPLCALLTIILYKKNKKTFVLQTILDIIIVIFYLLRSVNPNLLIFNNRLAQFAGRQNIEIIFECLVLLVLGITLFYNVYISSKNTKEGLLHILLLCAGFCSAFIIAFSPTIYPSGARCYLFMSYTIFLVTFDLFADKISEKTDSICFNV